MRKGLFSASNAPALSFGLVLLLAGCAGPTTPLGSVWTLNPKRIKVKWAAGTHTSKRLNSRQIAKITEPGRPSIIFRPGRQVLHGRSTWKVEVNDPMGIPRNHELVVFYNGLNVTRSFLAHADFRLSDGNRRFTLEFSDLRIQPTKENLIEVLYRRHALSSGVYAEYLPPVCPAYDLQHVLTTGKFEPDPELVALLDQLAQKKRHEPKLYDRARGPGIEFRSSSRELGEGDWHYTDYPSC